MFRGMLMNKILLTSCGKFVQMNPDENHDNEQLNQSQCVYVCMWGILRAE